MGSVIKYKHVTVPRQNGEQARLKVVQGPDLGVVYVITSSRVTIGRGEENDVVLSDLKTSRIHAEFSIGNSGWKVKDLGSSNGLQWNGKNVLVAELHTNDIVSLGETTVEFFSADVPIALLAAPPRALADVRTEHSNFDSRRSEVRALGGQISKSSAMGQSNSQTAQNKSAPGFLGVGAIAIGLVILIFSSSTPEKKKKSKVEEKRDIASYLPSISPLTKEKSVERFFKEGFREYREKNYLRAKTHFETVLQIAPAHALARIYLENSEQAIQNEVKVHLERGKTSLFAGKEKKARGHFESVLRLLFRDAQNPQYIEARESLDRLDKSKEGGGG